MVLTKDELIRCVSNEVRILLHLISKVGPAMLDYRPSPKQRSTLELLQYLTIMGPVHMRGAMAEVFDMDSWRHDWNTAEAAAKMMDIDAVKDAIGKQPALLAELLGSCSDAGLRAEFEMFGQRASRGSWLVNLVLTHYAAYRMQLFLYLKASGREELNTLNLWVGTDGAM
jgi:hypothetical protein